MNKFMEIMEKYFIPVAAKMGAQRHLVSIRDAFVAIMPLVIAGSFAVLLNNFDLFGYQDFMVSMFGADWKTINGAIWDGSFGVMSFLVVFTCAYSLAKTYDKDALSCGAVCFAGLFMLMENSAAWGAWGGSNGLFVALGVALIFGTIYCKLLGNPKLTIKMPDGVPPAVAKSFAALAPSVIVLILVGILKVVLLWVAGIPNLHQFIFDVIQEPAQKIMSESLGPVLILIIFQQVLWFFGLHGANIIGPIVNAVLLPLTTANVEAVAAGEKAQYIVNSQFLDSFVNLGGSGATLCLLISIFIFSKNKANRAIASLGIAPGCFNINEPVIFGMPIVLNPIYIIPFILVPVACASIAYGLTSVGFMPVVSALPGWTTPPVLGAFLSTGGAWQGAAVAALNVVVGIIIYTPFVMVADRKAALEEAQGLNQ
ncbi:MAG: PTS sugar transporter subunit IIC [Clostridium sp.]